jgi:VCBS repeat-containing protein
VSITDPDDTPTGYVTGSATLVSATVPGGLPSSLTNQTFLSSLLTIGADGTVSYDRSNFAFLAAGQSLSYTIGFDVKSGPDTVHLTLTFTVNGGNEAPTISIGPGDSAAATITDDTHATGTDLVAHGTLSFKDPDVTDAHSVSVAVKSGPAIGAFLAGKFVDTTGSEAGVTGDIGWTFAANKAYVQSLAAGQTATEVFTISLSDGHGGTASQDVSVTVVGVNDAPVINGPITASVQEDVATRAPSDPSHPLTLTAADPTSPTRRPGASSAQAQRTLRTISSRSMSSKSSRQLPTPSRSTIRSPAIPRPQRHQASAISSPAHSRPMVRPLAPF